MKIGRVTSVAAITLGAVALTIGGCGKEDKKAGAPGNRPRRWNSSSRPAPAAAPTRWRAPSRHHRQARVDEAVDGSWFQQVRRRRRRGFPRRQGAKGDPHKIIITLSNLFTTPLATGVPFSWKDLTPVKMMALDEFVLWVNAETPYRSAKGVRCGGEEGRRGQVQDGRHRLAPGRPDHHRVDRAEDRRQVHLRAVQGRRRCPRCSWSASTPDSTVNNPIEAVAHWRGGKLRRCACSTRSRCPTRARSPTRCRGKTFRPASRRASDVDYLMLARIFMSGWRDVRAGRYYVQLMRKVQETPEWKQLMEQGAFNTTSLEGKEYATWVAKEEQRHVELMKAAGSSPRRSSRLR